MSYTCTNIYGVRYQTHSYASCTAEGGGTTQEQAVANRAALIGETGETGANGMQQARRQAQRARAQAQRGTQHARKQTAAQRQRQREHAATQRGRQGQRRQRMRERQQQLRAQGYNQNDAAYWASQEEAAYAEYEDPYGTGTDMGPQTSYFSPDDPTVGMGPVGPGETTPAKTTTIDSEDEVIRTGGFMQSP